MARGSHMHGSSHIAVGVSSLVIATVGTGT